MDSSDVENENLSQDMIIKDLKNKLQYQKALCEELQRALIVESHPPKTKKEDENKVEKRAYKTNTPLKEYIQKNKNNEKVLDALYNLQGIEKSQPLPLQLVRSYLTVLFKQQVGGQVV